MNGVIVIVTYRPKPGKEKELLEVVRNHRGLRMEIAGSDRCRAQESEHARDVE